MRSVERVIADRLVERGVKIDPAIWNGHLPYLRGKVRGVWGHIMYRYGDGVANNFPSVDGRFHFSDQQHSEIYSPIIYFFFYHKEKNVINNLESHPEPVAC